MKYQPPHGSNDPDAPYVDRNTPGAVAGSKVPAAALEDPQREMQSLIARSGFTPSDADLEQMTRAIRSLGLNFAFAGGTANALTATLAPAPAAYTELRMLMVAAGLTNTGPATININGFGAQVIVRADGSALVAGDIAPGQILILVRSGAGWQIAGLNSAVSGLGKVEVFTTSGSWMPPPGITKAKRVRVWGPGGGGGRSGGTGAIGAGGAAGAYGEMFDVSVTPGVAVPITVGAGGSAGIGGSINGGTGGSSSFGAYLTVAGGAGGGGAGTGTGTPGAPTAAPTVTNGIALAGGRGFQGALGSTPLAGNGGSAPFGGGQTPATSTSSGASGNYPGGGGGGGGAVSGGADGGAGAGGLVIVEY